MPEKRREREKTKGKRKIQWKKQKKRQEMQTRQLGQGMLQTKGSYEGRDKLIKE